MGEKANRWSRLLCGCSLVTPIFAAPAAAAQPAPQTTAPPEQTTAPSQATPNAAGLIIVTGSRIPRTNLTAVSPVTVLRQDEVKLQGSIMAEELLDQLPQVAPSQGAFISNGASGTATVDLRNLGAQRTLVLINGRRLGPGDASTPVADINIVPTTLIQRVEVLTGGAASVYGSDAVSGVVNFILDTSFKGFRIDGQASVYQHDNRNGSDLRAPLERRHFGFPTGNVVDGGRQDINIAYGTGFFDDRLHVSIYAGYRELAPLTQDRRDYSACTATVNQQDDSILECGGSFVSAPANFLTNFDFFTVGENRTFEPGFTRFNFGPWNYYQRSDRRYTAGGFANAEISRALKPYFELMYMDDRSAAQIAPSGDFGNTTSINCDNNPLLSDQQRSLVCFDGNFVGQRALFDDDGNLVEIQGAPIPFIDPVTGATYFKGNLEIDRRNVEGGGRRDDLRHKTIRVIGGTTGDLARGVTYDASYLYGRNKLSDLHSADFSVSRLRRALDVVTNPSTGEPVCRSVLTGEDPACVPWDVFALGTVTPEATAYLSVPALVRGTVKEQIANANATVQLDEWGIRSPWAAEGPALNAGAEYRKDRLDFLPDPGSADLAGVGTEILPVHGSIEVKELFAEARVPLITGRLIERLALEGGYRKSWYKGADVSFSTNAYKLALDLTAVRGLRFRASRQRAVRAPNVVELFAPRSSDFFFHDPCTGTSPDATAEQCANTGVTATQYGHIIGVPDEGLLAFNAVMGGNLELQPEVAKTATAGVVVEPRFLPGFNATVDWWDIKLNQAVAYVSGDDIIDNCAVTGDPFFCARIHRDASGSLWQTPQGFIDTRLFNIGSLRVSGVDVGVNYRRGLGRFGSATLDFLGSYVRKTIIDNGGLSKPVECAGRYGVVCGNPVPRWRHKARLTWEDKSGPSLSFNWRYYSRMSQVPVPGLPPPGPLTAHLPSRSYFDLAALFRVKKRSLRIGVNNIFDREPPLVASGTGACSTQACNGNTYPQWYDPLGRYFFAGATIDF